MTPEHANTLATMIMLAYRDTGERRNQCERLNDLYPEFVWSVDAGDWVTVHRSAGTAAD